MVDAKISEACLARGRAETRLAVVGELGKLYEALAKEGKINQTRIAERLGKSRQAISKLLTSPGQNWTLDSVADLLVAMDSRIMSINLAPADMIVDQSIFSGWIADAYSNSFDELMKRPLQDLQQSQVADTPALSAGGRTSSFDADPSALARLLNAQPSFKPPTQLKAFDHA